MSVVSSDNEPTDDAGLVRLVESPPTEPPPPLPLLTSNADSLTERLKSCHTCDISRRDDKQSCDKLSVICTYYFTITKSSSRQTQPSVDDVSGPRNASGSSNAEDLSLLNHANDTEQPPSADTGEIHLATVVMLLCQSLLLTQSCVLHIFLALNGLCSLAFFIFWLFLDLFVSCCKCDCQYQSCWLSLMQSVMC